MCNKITHTNKDERWKLLILAVKHAAKQKQITQREIAEITGFDRPNANRMLNCNSSITLANFIKLANSVGINLCIDIDDDIIDINSILEKAKQELKTKSSR